MCQETNEQGSNHRDPQLRTSPTSLNFRIFSRNQPKGPASQPAHTRVAQRASHGGGFFFSFLMTYYMYALLLLVVSIDAGRDYRAPVQNRCSKGALRPRSVLSPIRASSSRLAFASFSFFSCSETCGLRARCGCGDAIQIQRVGLQERARLFMLRGSVTAHEGNRNGVGCTAQ